MYFIITMIAVAMGAPTMTASSIVVLSIILILLKELGNKYKYGYTGRNYHETAEGKGVGEDYGSHGAGVRNVHADKGH